MEKVNQEREHTLETISELKKQHKIEIQNLRRKQYYLGIKNKNLEQTINTKDLKGNINEMMKGMR